ncbi:hypothetical protein CKO19_07285 [Rhodovulum adriaticum]|nr:hypothetical protein [Rhodovulum adriaticum]
MAAAVNRDCFDSHAAASVLALGMSEGDNLCARTGLDGAALDGLAARLFPTRRAALADMAGPLPEAEVEQDSVRALLMQHAGHDAPLTRWFAMMIARRAMEPDHLWQDLGLRDRGELNTLLTRHFGPLAAKNTNNMKWKRFFYRQLCEAEGFVLCTTPVCTDCADFDMCFGEETGEARLARARLTEPT